MVKSEEETELEFICLPAKNSVIQVYNDSSEFLVVVVFVVWPPSIFLLAWLSIQAKSNLISFPCSQFWSRSFIRFDQINFGLPWSGWRASAITITTPMKTICEDTPNFALGVRKKKNLAQSDLFKTNRKHDIQIKIVLINWQWPQNRNRQTGRLG